MAYQGINTGTSPNSGTGDSLIEGAEKINSNFIELYNVVGNGTTTYVGVVTQITAGTNVSISTSYGSVEVSAPTPSQLTTTNLSVSGISTLTNVVVGATTEHTLTVTGTVSSDLVPTITQNYNLGYSQLAWNNAYINFGHFGPVSSSSSITAAEKFYGNGSNLVGVVTTLNGADASNVVGITTLISAGNDISVTTNSGISTISYVGAANTATINADSLFVSGISTLTNVVVGTTTEHNLTVTGKVDSNLIPAAHQTYNLGKNDFKWNNVYVNVGHFTLATCGKVSASSSITASGGLYGDGSNLTGIVTTLNGANASDVVGITTLIKGINNISVTTNAGISTISYTGVANTANINADSINVSGLSTFTGNISCGQSIILGNNGKILLGTTPDLQIYHDDDNSYIVDSGTGSLRIDSSFLEIRNVTGTARAATFSLGTGASGGTQLYFNGTKKFQTTSTGSLVTGITTSTEGFSSGTGSPVKISVVGNTLTFTVDGIGSTALTLS